MAVQLLLNAAWSAIFFGLRRPDLAFAELVVFWVAILVTVVLFWPLQRIAALLLLPYLAWVAFAGVLNLTLWRMNAGRA
jgi:tryptophan-rich sensory protein